MMSKNVRAKMKSGKEIAEMLRPHIEAKISEMDLSDIETGQSQQHEGEMEERDEPSE